MKPRKTFDIYWNDDERERMEDSMLDWWDDEDNIIERERDLKQGQQDIRDEYDEVEDADDLRDVL